MSELDGAKKQVEQDIEKVNSDFNKQLQQQIDGTLPKGHIYQLGNADGILNAAGLPNLPIELASSRLNDKSMQDNHPFELSEIIDLPNAIHNPLAVFRSATRIGGFVVMTEIEHRGKNFVVAIEANRRSGKIEVNSIRSIHYRTSNSHIANWISEGLLEYANKIKMPEWLSKQQYNSADVRKLFKHATKIIQDFENPTINDVKYQIGSSKSFIPNVRGGWTKNKIVKYLKLKSSDIKSNYGIIEAIADYDSFEDFKNNIYYHGTTNHPEKGLKPSITMTERQAEMYGGGGYGERYFGISLTKSKRVAEHFSGTKSFVDIYPVLLKKDAIIENREDLEDASDVEDIIVDLYNKGVDAVWIVGGEQELVIINPYAAILYKNGRESFKVFGGFKSIEPTVEELRNTFEKAKKEYPELKKQYISLTTKDEKNNFLYNLESIKFFQTPSGTIYGFVKNGVVYLNSSTPNLNTPIHEFGHLWIDAIEGSELYNRGAEHVKDTPYWERVNADPNYNTLSEAARIKEAMVQAIGDKGEAVKRNLTLYARIKTWINDVWKRIGTQFGIQNLTPEQIQNLTFNDFVEVAVSELMSGENLAERNKNTNLATPKNNNGSNEKTRLDNRRTMASEPERLPLGTITSSNAVGNTIAGTTTPNTRGSRTGNAKSQSQPWIKSEALKQLAEQAKANGTWIVDITTLTDGKEHFANGTENKVYRSKDEHKVIKVNNLLFLNENDTEYTYTRDLDYFFDRISAHNALFPEDAYNIVGFTENEAGEICIVMEQPYISSNAHPTIEQIETDLAKRGFIKTTLGAGINQGLTGYTNGIYELTDVKPLNVLTDKNGKLHYIDLDISKTNDNIQFSIIDTPEYEPGTPLAEYAAKVVTQNQTQAQVRFRMADVPTPPVIDNSMSLEEITDKVTAFHKETGEVFKDVNREMGKISEFYTAYIDRVRALEKYMLTLN